MTFSVPRMVDNWQCRGLMKSLERKTKQDKRTKPFSVPVTPIRCRATSDPREVRAMAGHAGPRARSPARCFARTSWTPAFLVLLLKSSWRRAPVLVPLPRGRRRAAAAQHVRQKAVFLPAASLGPRYRRHSERFALHLLPCAKHTQS